MYPALAVSETLKNETNTSRGVGSQGGMERELVVRSGIAFKEIPAAGVHGVSLKKLPGNLVRLWKGYSQSKQILREFKPDALFFTGGYVAIPMALAGLKFKSLLYVPDLEPGLALKTLARWSDRIAVTVEQTKAFFKHQERVTVTGYPLRAELTGWTKAKALEYFGFDPALPTLLFMGGSSGARSINNAVLAIADQLTSRYQVLHLTGHLDWEALQPRIKQLGPRYQAFPYLHEMGAALSVADLVVSRAGASILGEYPFFGLPAVLVPYPYAWRYQKVNADYLVDRQAAVLLEDKFLTSHLLATIEELMGDSARLSHMARAMAALANPKAAENIAALLMEMAEG